MRLVLLAAAAAALCAAPAAALPVLQASAASVRVAQPEYGCEYTPTPLASNLLGLSAAPLEFTLVVAARNMPRLHAEVLRRADPRSADYGRWMSLAEVDALTLPSARSIAVVTRWLDSNDIAYTVERDAIRVQTTLAAAAKLLNTQFYRVTHIDPETPSVVRAGAYEIPADVHAVLGGIFGLHGLPLPAKKALRSEVSALPPSVTPAVIYQTYSVGNVTVNRNSNNKQSVGEFQGQYMNKNDLSKFFTEEVPNAQPGDDQVYQFIGRPYTAGYGVEAELDIEFIMGVAPGVKTQFWEWPNNDFCSDLQGYTSHMLSNDTPNVNSISYGWQGSLSQVGCTTAEVTAVDNNFAKLAAMGVSIMISSGDSGSGYTSYQCNIGAPGKRGVNITAGVVERTLNTGLYACCTMSAAFGAQGWTWNPPSASEASVETMELNLGAARASLLLAPNSRNLPGQATPIQFPTTSYYCSEANDPDFPEGDTYELSGTLSSTGGNIKVHNDNNTFADTYITFSAPYTPAGSSQVQRNISMSIKPTTGHQAHFVGVATFGSQNYPQQLQWTNPNTGSTVATWLVGSQPPPSTKGTCRLYSFIQSTGSAPQTVWSGGPGIDPTPDHPILYPSWPASSQWVTAVGATRFINQKVGQGEMASDQFGSGGGFSTMFNASSYQQAAVAAYLQQASKLAKFPPTGSFPANGRATPDVSALGEGFMVYTDGIPQPVGGTSASSPTFAALISLINEARTASGKPVMGFLNPFLYQCSGCFYDVTEGTNAIARSGTPVPFGFEAAPGWDAATGLGTPHFDKLRAAALQAVGVQP